MLSNVFFVVERIYGAYEEKNCEIGRFNLDTGRRVRRQADESVCFCEDDGRFANGNKRDIAVRSGERVLGSFVSAEKGRTVAGRLRLVARPFLHHRISSKAKFLLWKQPWRCRLRR